ncbi:hypothetical protein BZL30_8361 [Mycobacterium kansasii]|uniref:Uncharacterized protein n=1 Tax=Mycobacterium kansasii TaxID=1768 RepID=A0A1V3WI12_MYCKA|nr:hypothetical protein BZL30_8361 [Mycobacterium kansasii]
MAVAECLPRHLHGPRSRGRWRWPDADQPGKRDRSNAAGCAQDQARNPAPISAASEKRRRSRPGSATTAGGARRVRELAQGRSRRCSRRRSYGSSGRRVCSVIATVMAVLEVDLKNLGARAVY